MRIEKIELIGFKSFSEKTTFNLHPGITCIVGPNGSGKSNVVDSFRWVLGEQSAKSLRGEKMEEVIFNGSTAKKPRGMSEVSLLLTFDSPEQDNGGSNHTSVSRRLYRSGESEYLLNRNQCRLKDIKDLFLDTGLEVRSYSILEQGKISEILNSKPQERRFLIEEVAGVMKYKVRRAEALSKLESSRLNLQRINDIITEVRRQINSLDRQVRKAERFKKLSAEMRAIELKLSRRDYAALTESLNSILKDSALIKEEEAAVRADLASIENTIETKKIGLLEKGKILESLISELQGLEKEIADADRAVAVTATEGSNLRDNLMKLQQQEAELAGKITGIEERGKELYSTERTLTAEIDALKQELAGKNESVMAMESELYEKEELIESKRREIFRIAETISHLRNETGRLTTTIDNLESRGLSAIKESETVKSQLSAIESSIIDTDGSLIAKNNELILLNEKKGTLTAGIEEYTLKLQDLRNRISVTREDFASGNSRLNSFREIIHEEASEDIITEKENLRIMASVAEVIEVDEAYEKAIESALSEKVNAFILPSFEDISNAVSTLKQKGTGRTVFIPMDSASSAANETIALNSADGLIGRASDLVRVQNKEYSFSPVIMALLNNIFVAKDLPSAFSLSMTNNRLTFVTVDGEVLEPSGAVTLSGSRGVLKRKRETRELESLLKQKKAEIEYLEGTLINTENSIISQGESLKDIESSIISAEKEVSLMKLTADNQMEEKEKLSRKLVYLNIEHEETMKEKESLKQVLAEKEIEIAKTNSNMADAEHIVARMLEALAKNKEVYETERTSITDLRLTLNSYKERTESVRKEIETSAKMIEEISSVRGLLSQEKSNIESRIAQCSEDIKKNNDLLKVLVLKADNLKKVITENREIMRSESEGIERSEQGLKSLRNSLDSLTSRISEADVSIAEHRLRIETLSEGVRLNYGLEIDTLADEPVTSEDEEHLPDIMAKIQELGLVNLGTLDEYEELKTRYEFLTKQQDDLNKSIAELEEAITKINSTTRKKLREAFEQLNAKFSEVFTHLFSGGKAELVLTDENNILDSGIDIVAQPPGKKLQNINLLSGGEKALTALSILFASFLIKPTPLCILDEVDAPLDDSNVVRFSTMLKELSNRIQFIIVTHNRITMESADYIYGITMEEPGVSKVISMQLTEA